MFFSGTTWQRLSIPETSLADGRLDPGESIALEQIFKHFDKCGADFEVSIPAESIAALGICAALGFGIGSAPCTAAAGFASAFMVSLSAKGSSIYLRWHGKSRRL